jgi:hypothetical protein
MFRTAGLRGSHRQPVRCSEGPPPTRLARPVLQALPVEAGGAEHVEDVAETARVFPVQELAHSPEHHVFDAHDQHGPSAGEFDRLGLVSVVKLCAGRFEGDCLVEHPVAGE